MNALRVRRHSAHPQSGSPVTGVNVYRTSSQTNALARGYRDGRAEHSGGGSTVFTESAVTRSSASAWSKSSRCAGPPRRPPPAAGPRPRPQRPARRRLPPLVPASTRHRTPWHSRRSLPQFVPLSKTCRVPRRTWLDSKIDVFLEELAASSMHLDRQRAGELITGQVRSNPHESHRGNRPHLSRRRDHQGHGPADAVRSRGERPGADLLEAPRTVPRPLALVGITVAAPAEAMQVRAANEPPGHLRDVITTWGPGSPSRKTSGVWLSCANARSRHRGQLE